MIYIAFALRNPWLNRHETIVNKEIAVTKNKTIEVALYRNTCLFEFGFGISSFKQDHAGFNFNIGFFGYDFDFNFYDNRHYDERTN
jgi:hypothetical protein